MTLLFTTLNILQMFTAILVNTLPNQSQVDFYNYGRLLMNETGRPYCSFSCFNDSFLLEFHPIYIFPSGQNIEIDRSYFVCVCSYPIKSLL